MAYIDENQVVDILNSMKFPVLGAGGGFAPLGTVNAYMGTTAPQGWLICNGQTVNIADYPELATHFASHFGSANFFGGDGTTTIAVPDLRGEFLRGSGTNSHTNQGDGGAVGEHQDGTETAWENYARSGSLYVGGTSDIIGEPKEYDSQIGSSSGRTIYNKSSTDAANVPIKFTSRPTNTSVTYIIKATVSGDPDGHVYSTTEHIIGHDEDTGKIVYERTITGLSVSITTNNWQNVVALSGISSIVDYKMYFTSSGIDYILNCSYEVGYNKGNIVLKCDTGSGRTISKIIIRYTKTS